MNWSPLQSAIFTAVESDTESLRVEAKAGSGKTTTSIEALTRAKVPEVLALAFNKKIQLELEKRLPPTILAKTMNGLGHGAWGKALGRKLTLNQDKLYEIAKTLQPKDDFSEILNLARCARTAGIVPKQITSCRGIVPDETETWEDLAEHFDLESSLDTINAARELLFTSISQAKQGIIDFDDQIYCSALFGAPFRKFDLVLVDEAQDLSPVQHKMLAKSLKQTGRLIAVGDSHQAIYGFRGAAANSLDMLSAQFSLRSLPLSISYRCPQTVVAEAQKFVPDIESFPGAPVGVVEHWENWTLADLPSPCTIVCRNNAPLVQLAYALIRSGRGCTMLGRDIGKGLIKIIDKLAPQAMGTDQFLSKLDSWAKMEISRKARLRARIEDQQASLLALSHDCATTVQIKYMVEQLFSSKNAPYTLSSIHKAKGLEWQSVVFLDSDLIPSKYAVQEWQKEQEQNCAYIAVTRAQEKLIFAYTWGLEK